MDVKVVVARCDARAGDTSERSLERAMVALEDRNGSAWVAELV